MENIVGLNLRFAELVCACHLFSYNIFKANGTFFFLHIKLVKTVE